MDVSSSVLSCLVLVVMVTMVTSMSLGNLPEMGKPELANEVDQKNEEKTWMNARDLDQEFVDMVDLALQELASDERISGNIFPTTRTNDLKQKRGRFQGFCFKRTSTGRYLPFVCWKSDKRRK